MIDDYPSSPPESMADFMRRLALHWDRKMNPVFEGHRTTYPGQKPITVVQAAGLFGSRAIPVATGSYVATELLLTPIRSASIDVGPQGSYHLSSGDEVHYPFKNIIDLIFD